MAGSDGVFLEIGRRIKSARERVGISQQEMARCLGYASPATISHFESGERRIGIPDLQRIARMLGHPLEFFLGEGQNQLVSLPSSYHFRAAEIRPANRHAIIAFLSFARTHATEIVPLPDRLGRGKPGIAAAEILSRVGISGPPVSPRAVAVSLGVAVFDWEFPDEISGVVVYDDGKACIAINQAHPRVRQRFTLAHEIGHLVFDSDHLVFFDFFEESLASRSGNEAEAQRETRANRFAADLLMPQPWLRKEASQSEPDLLNLSQRYQVSQQALWFRLLDLHLISTDRMDYSAIESYSSGF